MSLTALAAPSVQKSRFPLPWKAADGWRGETIPFPLDFAPSLPYKGIEELRFAPGFFNPEAPDYFTYGFIWLVEDTIRVDETRLGKDLQAYFSGLMEAVGSDKGNAARPKREDTKVVVVADSVEAFSGTIDTWDAFTNGKELQLQFLAYEIPSPYAVENDLQLWYFEVSPRLQSGDIQGQLRGLREGLELKPDAKASR